MLAKGVALVGLALLSFALIAEAMFDKEKKEGGNEPGKSMREIGVVDEDPIARHVNQREGVHDERVELDEFEQSGINPIGVHTPEHSGAESGDHHVHSSLSHQRNAGSGAGQQKPLELPLQEKSPIRAEHIQPQPGDYFKGPPVNSQMSPKSPEKEDVKSLSETDVQKEIEKVEKPAHTEHPMKGKEGHNGDAQIPAAAEKEADSETREAADEPMKGSRVALSKDEEPSPSDQLNRKHQIVHVKSGKSMREIGVVNDEDPIARHANQREGVNDERIGLDEFEQPEINPKGVHTPKLNGAESGAAAAEEEDSVKKGAGKATKGSQKLKAVDPAIQKHQPEDQVEVEKAREEKIEAHHRGNRARKQEVENLNGM